MMRFLHIALIIAILLPVEGLAFSTHYCGGNLISFDFFQKYNEPCCEGMDEPCDACEDQEFIVSLDDFQYSQLDFSFSKIVTSILNQPSSFEKNLLIVFEEKAFSPSTTPHGRSGRKISILHQSFLL